MISSQYKQASNANYNQSYDETNTFQQHRRAQTQSQPLGFFAQLTQTIFGGGSSQNSNNVQQQQHSKSSVKGSNANAEPILQPGKTHLQVFLDTTFKNYTRIVVQDDVTAVEIIKILKAKYATSQSTSNSTILGNNLSFSHSLSSSSILDKSQYQSQFSGGMTIDSNSGGSIDFRKSAITSSNKNLKNDSYKEEYGLFLINTKSQNPLLSVRKLSSHDYVCRVYQKSLETFPRDGQDRFKLCFAKYGEIDQFIRSKGVFHTMFDEENHVVSQLGKSIINNKTYERKGKLYKKSLNSDKFKERQFVLDKDQLFYYKNEKQKDKNFNLIMLSNASVCIVHHPKQKYCFEIENDNRKYLLSSKSQYDLDQWVYAIQGQIRLSRDNKNIADVNQSIMLKEKEIAQHDMVLVQKIFKPKNVIFNPVQPILLDFINDPFINELLPNLTKFVTLVREKDYQRHALDKAKDIVQQLKALQKKLQKSITLQQSKSLEEQTKHADEKNNGTEVPIQVQKSQSQQTQKVNEDYKRYKELKPEQKIQLIFSEEDLNLVESEYEKIIKASQDSQGQQQLSINPRLFNNILLKINRIIKYNYLEDFFREKKVELLSIPTQNFKMNMTPMEFNSIGPSLFSKGTKNINIFEAMLTKNGSMTQQMYHPMVVQQQSSSNIDPNLQNQMKQFLGSITQEQKVNTSQFNEERATQISAISKVQNQ